MAMDFFSSFFRPPVAAPIETDPTKYPRAEEIQDSDALMLVTAFEVKQEEEAQLAEQVRELHDRLQIAASEREILATKLFQRLRAVYPDVAKRTPSGFRKHDGRYWYVSWDVMQ